jgi:hypothetical protein
LDITDKQVIDHLIQPEKIMKMQSFMQNKDHKKEVTNEFPKKYEIKSHSTANFFVGNVSITSRSKYNCSHARITSVLVFDAIAPFSR